MPTLNDLEPLDLDSRFLSTRQVGARLNDLLAALKNTQKDAAEGAVVDDSFAQIANDMFITLEYCSQFKKITSGDALEYYRVRLKRLKASAPAHSPNGS